MKNTKRKFQVAFVFAFALAFIFQSVHANAAPAASDSCGGCKAVNEVAEQYRKTSGKRNDDQTVDLILKAQAAIRKMPVSKGKLSAEQITQIVKLLKLSTPSDPGHAIIDDNIRLFQRNEKEFFEEFKKYSATERELMEDALNIKLGEYESGNG